METKALDWNFEEYKGRYVICYYITHAWQDNVVKDFEDINDAMEYMDENDLWDDYYIYYIKEDGFAYAPNF